MYKFTIIIALISLVCAIEIHHGTNGHEEHHAPAKYSFGYSVHDPHTGDIKSHKETRDGHRVEGSYELIDPDGHRRLVKYTADEHHGFNAVVYREPTDIKIPIPQPQHAKKILIHQPQKVLLQPAVHHTPIHFVNFIKEHHTQGSHHALSQGQSFQHRVFHL